MGSQGPSLTIYIATDNIVVLIKVSRFRPRDAVTGDGDDNLIGSIRHVEDNDRILDLGDSVSQHDVLAPGIDHTIVSLTGNERISVL